MLQYLKYLIMTNNPNSESHTVAQQLLADSSIRRCSRSVRENRRPRRAREGESSLGLHGWIRVPVWRLARRSKDVHTLRRGIPPK